MNVTESLFTQIIKLHFLQEGKGIFTTFGNFTLILLKNNHRAVNSGLRASFSNAF